ncbi:hypothetical protein QKU48_gp1421 [Fadolivirus algeromassiliense]|jgi:hypothetical protein|uniref:Uncharacterized protein n=1 Tax=Fadolivirus FV1/VV64 TaxID=3070911 RepID=A0A7D3QWR8_9VIRU|nr:hypothetical protein QKU48_gp1421 [Fadolivirus algeromassiliense]QKF94879.1 hypothetical protein Fadolivirus_1_1421 [Fadolivirus FV1/VV64]
MTDQSLQNSTNNLDLHQKLNILDENIDQLTKQIIPLEKQKKELLKEKTIIVAQIQKLCNHELVDHRYFDGHTTYSSYECQLCKYTSNFRDAFAVVKRVYDY